MESSPGRQEVAAKASASLREAEQTRAALIDHVRTPSWFFVVSGVAIAVQIATMAVGLATESWVVLTSGVVVFFVVSAWLLVWFRRSNGVSIAGLASRVVFGTGTIASIAYVVALGVTVWAAYVGLWWLVGLLAAAGGAAYALAGRRWLRNYRARPAELSRGDSILTLVTVVAVTLGGLAALLLAAS